MVKVRKINNNMVKLKSVVVTEEKKIRLILDAYENWSYNFPELFAILEQMWITDAFHTEENIKNYLLKRVDRCTVCLQEIKTFEEIVKISCCKHYYCESCMKELNKHQIKEKKKLTCPQCRKVIVFFRKHNGAPIMTIRRNENHEWQRRVRLADTTGYTR